MIRGLMTNAIDAGAVRIETGLSREEDVLLPRLAACPVSLLVDADGAPAEGREGDFGTS